MIKKCLKINGNPEICHLFFFFFNIICTLVPCISYSGCIFPFIFNCMCRRKTRFFASYFRSPLGHTAIGQFGQLLNWVRFLYLQLVHIKSGMTTKVIEYHKFSRGAVMVPGLTQFKKCLGNSLRSVVGFLRCPVQGQELDFHDPVQNTLEFYMFL